METILQRLTGTAEDLKHYQQERLILEITERVCKILAEDGVTRAELARRLNKTKSHVTQLLDGGANMTIKTIADIFTALGKEMKVVIQGMALEDRETLAAMKDQIPICTMTKEFINQDTWNLEEAGKITSSPSRVLSPVG